MKRGKKSPSSWELAWYCQLTNSVLMLNLISQISIRHYHQSQSLVKTKAKSLCKSIKHWQKQDHVLKTNITKHNPLSANMNTCHFFTNHIFHIAPFFGLSRPAIPSPWAMDQDQSVVRKQVKWNISIYSHSPVIKLLPRSVSCEVVAASESHKNMNCTMNCTWEGLRLFSLEEVLIPDDLKWSWGSGVGAGEHRPLKISIACRFIKTLSANDEWTPGMGL